MVHGSSAKVYDLPAMDSLHALQDQRDPLSYADAHRAESKSSLGRAELVQSGCYQTGAAGT
jgi:hypothetical protein